MQVLIYAGPATSRTTVLKFSAQIIQSVATSVTLLTGGGEVWRSQLDDAARELNIPEHVTVSYLVLPGDAQTAILTAASQSRYDLVIFGRLNQRAARLLPGPRSKEITQRLQPTVLRVHGAPRSIKRILIASGGDHHTYDDARITAQLAVPLGASVTLLHVVSQQSLVFEDAGARPDVAEHFLQGDSAEMQTLRESARILERQLVETQIKARVGLVLDEILSELRVGSYDLLVIGTHRITSPLDRILLEDITGDLLDLSPLPVLVVKG